MALEDLVEARQALLDPFPGRGLKDFLAAAAEAVEFFSKRVDLSLGVDERLGERAAAASVPDEVDEVRQPPFLGGEFRFLEPDGLRDMRVEFADLHRDALEDVLDVLRAGELGAHGIKDDPLDEGASDEQFVVAGPFGRGDAAVVAAVFTPDLGHGRSATSADQRARE